MKTFILKIGTVLCLLSLMGVGCKDNEKNEMFLNKEYFKFTDFGCDSAPVLKSEYNGNYYIITSQQNLEQYTTGNCIPKIDFSQYIVLMGSKQFTTGASLYDEKIEENSSEIIYTVTFQTNIAAVAPIVNYHVIIKKPAIAKSIQIVETIKDH